MYLRPDEVARVLEKAGFTMDSMNAGTYGYLRGEHYVYVNRDARMGRTALIIHPAMKERSLALADPASEMKLSENYTRFPLWLAVMPKRTTVFPTVLAHEWHWSAI